ncbi:MAG TPA: hypothetical protein VFJ51_11595 [Nitrososphaeraceae archaeon]|nr:hypothetical protein [Nitrososphaeraceae archaeon]
MRMQINNNRKNLNTGNNNTEAPNIEEERDLELENIVGNLMIAQYQVDKLRSRLSERVGGYSSVSNKKASVHVFKHNDKWYKVTTKVEEVSLDSNNVVKP